ncbi:MAG: flavin reductase family protein [Segetibacter sp.]|nr:flavin reductase family protein [Segetibacter sp.]
MIELPESIRQSNFLTDDHKRALRNVEDLPTVDPSFADEQVRQIFGYYSLAPDEMDVELHKYAAKLVAEGKVNEAWQVLLTSA